ncbi:MAG: DUF721 domain-containing protein [Paracoccaceae bacterium]|nr:DUF721 domain-containing protein [Paracoccaceae bacterium]
MTQAPRSPTRRMRGFEQTAGLLKERIRAAGEVRGFAVTRLLTQWTEIVGEEIASMALPVKVGYSRDGIGATLTLLTTGARAPMLEMQKSVIRDKVNACYGYSAISRIVITQTSASGFADGQVAFTPAPKAPRPVDPAVVAKAATVAGGVHDDGLRAALEALAQNILTRSAK